MTGAGASAPPFPGNKRARRSLYWEGPSYLKERDVLLLCGGCHATVTGTLIDGKLDFSAMAAVDTARTIAERRWDEAERLGHRRVSNRLLAEFNKIKTQPPRYIHRPCGGELAAFDIREAS